MEEEDLSVLPLEMYTHLKAEFPFWILGKGADKESNEGRPEKYFAGDHVTVREFLASLSMVINPNTISLVKLSTLMDYAGAALQVQHDWKNSLVLFLTSKILQGVVYPYTDRPRVIYLTRDLKYREWYCDAIPDAEMKAHLKACFPFGM